jgi:choline transport protein
VFEIWRQATRSDFAATVFLVLLLLAAIFALNATHQTASRLTWSFARDDALFGSRWLGKINKKQQVPMAALLFNFAIMFIIGCIYLGSTSAFNAFIGTGKNMALHQRHSADPSGLILQHVTYAFPAVLLMMRKRSPKWLPESRTFKVPSVLGWAANFTTAVFAIIVLIFYDFPTVIPVTGASMSELFQTLTPVAVTDFDRLCIRGHWCDDVVHNRKLVWPCAQTFPWTAPAGVAGVINVQPVGVCRF